MMASRHQVALNHTNVPEIHFEDTAELHPARNSIANVTNHLAVYLPEEPVGVGGVWQTTLT